MLKCALVNEIQPLVDGIRDELSTEVYYVYKDKRHFFLEAFATAVATACLIEYVKGLVDPHGLGEKHREYLKDLAERLRAEDMISIRAEMDMLDKTANELMQSVHPQSTSANERAALESLKTALAQIGMPAVQAELHSQNIAQLVRDHVNA
jgi:hypothetical protein